MIVERFRGHGPSLPAPEHDEGALSEADDGRELAYFGRVGQMMGDLDHKMLLELGSEDRKM